MLDCQIITDEGYMRMIRHLNTGSSTSCYCVAVFSSGEFNTMTGLYVIGRNNTAISALMIRRRHTENS